tara:strand:- start:66 stop:818 length:753 start_codon:yes stop_codon:yes gene_type:complete
MKDIKKVQTLENKALTTQDLKKFKEALKENGYAQLQDLFTMILNTGARINEILPLKFIDINYKSNSISIESIKTSTPQIRTIILNEECIEVLSTLQHEYPNDIFVFQSRSSKNQKNKPASPISRQYVMKGFKTASDSTALPITVSSLRRHFATHMSFIASSHKVDHKYLAQLMGHETVTTTKSYINRELIAAPEANLEQSQKMDNGLESLLNSAISNNSSELSDIAKKHGISESDLNITLKTIQKLKEST